MNIMLESARSFLHYITQDKATLYVICPFNIGDFLINGGLCHALLKKKRKKTCVLIERDRFANSGLNFVGVSEVQYIPQLLMDLVRQYIYATREYETDNYVYGHFHMAQNFEDWNSLIVSKELSFVDSYKEDVFGLPLDTELLTPIIDAPKDFQKKRLHETYVLNKERTIILAPYANSTANLEEAFWTKLVAELKRKNNDYILYTNVALLNEKIIPGTAPIVTTFQELLYLAEQVNCFIGLRSGIFDLLALTGARLFYIKKSIESWRDNLDVNFKHRNSRDFHIANATERESVLAFMRQNKLSVLDAVNFDNRIRGSDVALDMNSLLAKIVNAV